VSEGGRRHPVALELRWQILARLGDWERARDVGEALIALVPDSCEGWLHRAYALRRCVQGGLEQAWEALHPAADRFPEEEVVATTCLLRPSSDAPTRWEWFLRALQISKILPDAARAAAISAALAEIGSLRP
jgi:hypothetical protein